MSDKDRQGNANTPPPSLGVYGQSASVANAYRRIGEMQERSRLRRILGDPALSARRPLYIVAGLLILSAIVLNYSLLFIVGLLILAIAVVPELWYAYSLRGLVFLRAPEVTRTSFASVVEVQMVVENRSVLPLPFVEVQDNFPDDTPALGMSIEISPLPERAELVQAMGLWAFQRLRRRFYIRAAHRGVFTFGPTKIKVTDPFGVLTREETLSTEQTLIVHPIAAPLERFGLDPRAPFGDRASRMRLLEDPLRISGVRQYLPGDDPRRIHWKATARTGVPQSKILDPSTQRTLMIALDVRTFKTVQMGYDPALSELVISAAASVATWAFHNGYAVGLLSNGTLSTVGNSESVITDARAKMSAEQAPGSSLRLRLDPSARPEGLAFILDGLSKLLPYNSASLANLLTSERRSLPVGASLIYIGLDSMVDVPTLIALREIRARGRDVSLLLTSREEPSVARDDVARNLHAGMLNTHYIGGRATWHEFVQEALGDLAVRKASESLKPDQLRRERSLIAERRSQRYMISAIEHGRSPESSVHGYKTNQCEEDDGSHSSAVS